MTYKYYYETIHLISPHFTRKDLEDEEKLDFWWSSFRLWKNYSLSFLHFLIYFLFTYWSGVHDLGTLQTEFMYRWSLRYMTSAHHFWEGLLWSTGHVAFTVSHSFDPFWGWSTVFVSGSPVSKWKTFREPSTDAVPGASYPICLTVYIFKGENRILFCVCISYWFKSYLGKKNLKCLGLSFKITRIHFLNKNGDIIKGRDFQRMSWQKIEVVIKITHSSMIHHNSRR